MPEACFICGVPASGLFFRLRPGGGRGLTASDKTAGATQQSRQLRSDKASIQQGLQTTIVFEINTLAHGSCCTTCAGLVSNQWSVPNQNELEMLVVCLGMTRSGSTLQYNLAAELVESTGRGRREGFFEEEEIGAIRRKLLRWCNDEECHVLKSHKWIPLEGLPANRVRFLLVYRDPLDVANSAKKKWNHTVEKTIALIDLSIENLQRLDNDERALIQYYDELSDEAGISAISDHLGITVTDEIVAQVSARTSKERTSAAMQETNASLLKSLLNWARSRGITVKLGAMLRALRLPPELYYRLRRLSSEYDSRSLYHADHMAVDEGFVLSDEETAKLKERYSHLKWYRRTS